MIILSSFDISDLDFTSAIQNIEIYIIDFIKLLVYPINRSCQDFI